MTSASDRGTETPLRRRKPHLWMLAALTVIMVAILAALHGRVPLPGYRVRNANTVMILYLVCTFFLLAVTLRRQLSYNPYSYNTVYYAGFALFVLTVLWTHVSLAYSLRVQWEAVTERDFARILANSAENFIALTRPAIFLMAAALVVSNAVLLRREGVAPGNMLGLVLAALLAGGAQVLAILGRMKLSTQTGIFWVDLLTNQFAAVYLYFECMVIGTMAACVGVSLYTPPPDRDAVIILGCALRRNGTPTPLLEGRIRRAMEFDRMQQAAGGVPVRFVVSGGQGKNEVIPEAESMRRFLNAQGIGDERIIMEDRSTSTRENMAFSKALIAAWKPEARVAFSTTRYHVFRAGLMARREHLPALGMGAGTRWYYWPNATVREFAGLLAGHRGKQLLILGGVMVVYLVATVLSYRL